MATQFDPIAKDESLNTTEVTPRNIADVLAEELSAIEQAIAGSSGSGGHTIVNASGTDMTQRAKMQFVDAVVTDDAVNDVTKISTTPESYPASRITYESVSVTADGVKTYGQLFNALFSLADESKIGRSSSIVIIDQVFFTNRDGENGIYEFAFFNMAKQSPFLFLYRLRISNNSEMVVFNPSGYSDETSSIPASGAKITLYY